MRRREGGEKKKKNSSNLHTKKGKTCSEMEKYQDLC